MENELKYRNLIG
jgi:hypothetical protein